MNITWGIAIVLISILIYGLVTYFFKAKSKKFISSNPLTGNEEEILHKYVFNACKAKCSIAINWNLIPNIIDMLTGGLAKIHPGANITLFEIKKGVRVKCNKCNYNDADILDKLYYFKSLESIGGYIRTISKSRNNYSLEHGMCPLCGERKAYITISPTNIVKRNNSSK